MYVCMLQAIRKLTKEVVCGFLEKKSFYFGTPIALHVRQGNSDDMVYKVLRRLLKPFYITC